MEARAVGVPMFEMMCIHSITPCPCPPLRTSKSRWHQSPGKSALIGALAGFQFNQIDGGTKTRRPIALHMQYDPRCTPPRCFL